MLYRRYRFDMYVLLCLVWGYKVVPLPDCISAVSLHIPVVGSFV